MQRNYSVDDILGTFWKLDTQAEPKGPAVSIPEETEDEDTHIPVVESLRTIEVDRGGMNRSASEYAFQEFLKVSESGGFARSKSRFMTNEGIRDNNHDDEEDDTDPPSPASPASPESPETSENTRTELSKQGSDEVKNEADKAMPSSFVLPKLEVRPLEVRTISGVVDQEEVRGALNPLFSGIRDEVENAATATNSPQEYEYFLKHKLDIACAAVALARVRWSRSLSCSENLVFLFFWVLLKLWKLVLQLTSSSEGQLQCQDVIFRFAHRRMHT